MRRSDVIALGMVLGLAGAVCAPADDEPKPPHTVAAAVPPFPTPTPAPAPTPAAEAGKPVQLASTDLGGLDALLPVGKTARKVVVPSIDEDGVLTSVTRMGKITRIDEDRFALENVLLTSFDAEKIDPATGKPETTVVKISKGVYISSEKKLVSDRPVRITMPGVVITGESLVCWSVEGRYVIKGYSETLLTGLEAPAPVPAADEPATPDTVPPVVAEPVPETPPDREIPSQSKAQ